MKYLTLFEGFYNDFIDNSKKKYKNIIDETKDILLGQWYYGNFRNSIFGKWNASKSVFHHIRYSFGYYWDDCNHFEDDNRFALFVPLREATPDEIKNELEKVETSK